MNELLVVEVVGSIVVLIASSVIGAVIGAVFLRLGASWVAKRHISFSAAFWTALIATAIHAVTAIVAGFVYVYVDGPESGHLYVQLAMVPIGMVVYAATIAWRHDLHFARSLLIALIIYALTLALFVAGFSVLYLLTMLIFPY